MYEADKEWIRSGKEFYIETVHLYYDGAQTPPPPVTYPDCLKIISIRDLIECIQTGHLYRKNK